MNFTTFKFGNELQEGLDMMGFEKATPVQEKI
jgi:superfamily II DNA/RNA helicase